jgi:hypothetical protein
MKKDLNTFLTENYNDKVKIEIECTESAAYESILKILSYMKMNGEIGHSFSIKADENIKVKTFSFDGDGSHKIFHIKINNKEYKK